MYTTPSDGGGIPWNNGNSSGIVNLYTPTTESTTGGEASTAAFIGVDSDSDTGGVQPFQAPEYCYNLDAHGHQDWYVPARDEFFVLHDNQADIGGFGSTYYWTATEVSIDAMIFVNITDRSTGSGVKHFANEVRCVRKGNPPWGSSGLSGPTGCPNIGDQCADGTVFAGWDPVRHDHLFIPPTDQEQPGSPGTFTMEWKNATGTDDVSPDSDNDGEANHANLGGTISDFQAFQTCEDLSFGGHSDWYLPSRVELYYIWSVRGAIEAGGNITNFQNTNYWSSTEIDWYDAWNQVFTNGGVYNGNKTLTFRVRCVRR